ncbi:MAG: PfkB family carbohydrate kinase [Melioribacteraceae bacterium]|nr:PfkB family carbohydrate kinase [Melioribacteraceae bacterium]
MDKITAVGEILFDVYPERKNLGGAPLNFLYHIYKLAGKGNIISRVGHDILGAKALEFLKNNSIPTKYIQKDHLHPTGVTNVTLDGNKIPSFNIDEERAYDYIEMNDEINKLINEKTNCVYFGSLAQRSEVTRATIQDLFGRNLKYFCDLNIRQNFYSEEILIKSLTASNVLKLNIDELKLINDLLLDRKFVAEDTADEIMKNYNVELIAVTKGAEGSTLFLDDERDDYITSSSSVVDTLGAGDAFAAIICLGYVKSWELSKMNMLANEFANRICQIEGALPQTDEIYVLLKQRFDEE